MERLSSFTLDFDKESHLILPFSTLPMTSECFKDERGSIFIRSYGYLFAVTDCLDPDLNFFKKDPKIKHIFYPTKEISVNCRFLMKKEGEADDYDKKATSEELEAFYMTYTPFDVDAEYIEDRIKEGEKIYTVRDEKGKIISALYTTKGHHQIVDVATRCDYTGKGYATELLKKVSNVYLFCESEELALFYSKRGFEIKRIYKELSEDEIRLLFHSRR